MSIYFKAGLAFKETWVKNSSPSPFGKKIYATSFAERATKLWKGYHVTEIAKVKSQIEQGSFDNQNKHIYWYPIVYKKGGDRSVLLFGGKEKGCWTADKPVILKIGSNCMWRWNDIYHFPFFPAEVAHKVKILGAWEINPEWIESRKKRTQYPTFLEKAQLSFQKMLETLKG